MPPSRLGDHTRAHRSARRFGIALQAAVVAIATLAVAPPAGAETYRYDNRLLRISQLTINDGTTDGASGDGDGFVECGERVVIQVEMDATTYHPHLWLPAPTMRVDARGAAVTLVGNDTSLMPDIAWNGPPVTAPDRFTVDVAADVEPWDTLWFVVDVIPSGGGDIFRQHRHVPIMCGHSGNAAVPSPQTFPVYGATSYDGTWLADREALIHEGVDVFAPQMTPVVASAPGIVSSVLWTNDPAHVGPILCCSIAIRHDDGWESWYIHLNNDTPGSDDDIGDWSPQTWELGYIPGLTVGDRVEAGDLIGWVGNSGNAKYTPHHLHWELHDPAGNPIDAYSLLTSATQPSDPYACDVTSVLCHLAGADRYQTAVIASQRAYPGGADVVYVATGTNFPDAVTAGPAAAAEGGPVLLTTRDVVPQATLQELARLDPATVVIVGGENAISASAALAIEAVVEGTVLRRHGETRFETAVALSQAAFPSGATTVYLATGADFPDALLATASAIRDGSPILLVRRTSIPAAVRAELTRLDPDHIVVMGGTAVVGNTVVGQLSAYAPDVVRMDAANRYSLSAAITGQDFPSHPTVYVVVGTRFPDALSAATLMTAELGPLLMVAPWELPDPVAVELAGQPGQEIIVIGGFGAVPLPVYAALARYAS